MCKDEGKGWTNGNAYNFKLNGQEDKESCFLKKNICGDILLAVYLYCANFYSDDNYEIRETLKDKDWQKN